MLVAGVHDGQFYGGPAQTQSAAIGGIRLRALTGQPSLEDAVIQLGARKSASGPS
jgi:hypothetical protein